jgi:predicted SAM-dependent methyltransferase
MLPYRIADKSLAVRGFISDVRKLRKLASMLNRQRTISTYIKSHKIRKLQIGSGEVKISGWLSGDLNPCSKDVIYLDATKKLPFPDSTFDYVFSEHMIEHISWGEGIFMLKECRRVLKTGGVLRVATPDLSVLLEMYCKETKTSSEKQYIKWITDEFLEGVKIYKSGFVVNALFRNWHHTFLYDGELLETAMREAGFRDIERVPVGASKHAALTGIERHGRIINNEKINRFETIVFEATGATNRDSIWPQPHLTWTKSLSSTVVRSAATRQMRERQSAIAKARWADPITGAKLRSAIRSPASRAKISEATKARWADPAGREKMIEAIRASHADPVSLQKKASATKERWADSSMREKIIAGMRTTSKRRRNRDTADR